ncbi:MAG: hypothetical protein N3E44_04880, partial [Candidatus Bathyarchaeota archaeon]|nr:hypothetical protein [Candidatus Bathyarchaeota archaeon]
SDTITTVIPKATYVVDLKNYLFLPKVVSTGAPETTLEFRITDELIVNILKPAEGSEWRRTDTVPVEVEVLYQDMVPVTAGEVNVTFEPRECTDAPKGAGKPKTIKLSYSPATRTWVGSFKIQKDNSTGTWTVKADAKDFYGNTGSDTNSIKVKAAILVVTTEVAPPASVPRASWVSWVIRVTYKGDGSPAKLELTLCTVYVVNATTKAIVGSAYLVEIAVGRYNVTWFVPADAPLGDYMFFIPKDGLQDDVTTCGVRNKGPEKDVDSPPFAVGITKLKVEVKTYSTKFDVKTERIAFTPGSIVYIGAYITYADSGVVMTAGYVRAYIYNATGHLVGEVPLAYDGGTRMWWGEWDSTRYPAGRYDVIVKARDPGYNVGEGATYFYISGLVISPTKGTVPPIGNTKCEKLKDANWLITATVYTDPVSGKSLGTTITISGVHFTPKTRVNVTVDWLPYPLVRAAIGAGKIALLAMNAPTDDVGSFATKIGFPTTIRGIYKITARDAKGLVMTAKFEVVPGMILTPDPVVGSALIKVIATGLPNGSSSVDLLIDDTDALSTIAGHAGEYLWARWRADAN